MSQLATISMNDTLGRFVRRMGTRYAPALEVRRLCESVPDGDALNESLPLALNQNAVLVRRLLKVLNSALFAPRSAVTNVDEACASVGAEQFQGLVLSLSVLDHPLVDGDPAFRQRFWRHAIVRAVVAQQLGRHLLPEPTVAPLAAAMFQAFSCGVLARELGSVYRDFLEHLHETHGSWAVLETTSLGFTHHALGRRILETWNVATNWKEMIAAVMVLGDKQASPSVAAPMLVNVLHLAELLTQVLTKQRPLAWSLFCEVAPRGELMPTAAAEQLIRELPPHVDEFARLFDVDIGGTGFILENFSHAQSVAADSSACELTKLLEETKQLGALVHGATQAATSPADGKVAAVLAQPIADAPHDLQTHLTHTLAACRQARCAVSLLLVEVDRYEALVQQLDDVALDRLRNRIARNLGLVTGQPTAVVAVSNCQWAVAIQDCDRHQAVDEAKQMLSLLRDGTSSALARITISIGAATLTVPPKNFPVVDLIHAAQRCLKAAHSAGGDGVKSIEL